LVCGYLAQGEGFQRWLQGGGFDPQRSWHWGFGAAGIGMIVGLAAFLGSWRSLNDPASPSAASASAPNDRKQDWRGLLAIGFFCVGAILFYAMQKQAGSSLTLFADRHTRTELFGWAFPSSWFQSVNALCVIVLAPIFSALWL